MLFRSTITVEKRIIYTHTHHTRKPQKQAQQPPTKTAPAKRKKDNIHTQPRKIRFLKSQNFYTKCLPRTLDYPRKTSKIRNNTRSADPEKATQSSTCSSRTPNQPPQLPKRILPRTPRILSVSFVIIQFFSDVYNQTVKF